MCLFCSYMYCLQEIASASHSEPENSEKLSTSATHSVFIIYYQSNSQTVTNCPEKIIHKHSEWEMERIFVDLK